MARQRGYVGIAGLAAFDRVAEGAGVRAIKTAVRARTLETIIRKRGGSIIAIAPQPGIGCRRREVGSRYPRSKRGVCS
jgi:hypothetical protein